MLRFVNDANVSLKILTQSLFSTCNSMILVIFTSSCTFLYIVNFLHQACIASLSWFSPFTQEIYLYTERLTGALSSHPRPSQARNQTRATDSDSKHPVQGRGLTGARKNRGISEPTGTSRGRLSHPGAARAPPRSRARRRCNLRLLCKRLRRQLTSPSRRNHVEQDSPPP